MIVDNIHNKSRCCERAGQSKWGEYVCLSCGVLNCYIHAPIWVDGYHHCFYCFSVTKEICEPNSNIIVEKGALGTSRRKALLIIDGLYIAGVQRHCLDLLDVFNDKAMSSDVLVLDGGGQWADSFLEKADNIVFDIKNRLSWKNLVNIIEFENYEFVTAHLTKAIQWASINVPNYITKFAHIHCEPSEHENITREWINKYSFKFDITFFPAKMTLDSFEKLIEDRVSSSKSGLNLKVLPNAVPRKYDLYRNIKSEAPLKPYNILKLAVVSRIDKDKFSISLFINTLKHLQTLVHGFEVCLAGDGESMDELRNAIKVSELSDKIHCLGFVHNTVHVYEWADVLFMPSKRESLPYALLESTSMRCPVVAPAVGYMKEIESSNMLYIFTPGDSFEAATLIKQAAETCISGLNINVKSLGFLDYDNWKEIVVDSYGLK